MAPPGLEGSQCSLIEAAALSSHIKVIIHVQMSRHVGDVLPNRKSQQRLCQF